MTHARGRGYSAFSGLFAQKAQVTRGDAVNSRRYAFGGYIAWMALLIAVYYKLPGLRAEA